MDTAATIIVSVFGSAGLFSLIQFLVSRHDGNNARLNQIDERLKSIDKKCDRNELATTRLQLFYLLETQPENEDAIEATAQRYFIELNGNAEAWAPFYKWAVKHEVDTGWYKALLERERKRENA